MNGLKVSSPKRLHMKTDTLIDRSFYPIDYAQSTIDELIVR